MKAVARLIASPVTSPTIKKPRSAGLCLDGAPVQTIGKTLASPEPQVG